MGVLVFVLIVAAIIAIAIFGFSVADKIQKAEKKSYCDKYRYMVDTLLNPDFPDEFVTHQVFRRAEQVMLTLRGMDDFRFVMVPDGKNVIIESSCTRMILEVHEDHLTGFIKQPGYRFENGVSENVINIKLTYTANELWPTKLWNVVRASLHDRIPQPRNT